MHQEEIKHKQAELRARFTRLKTTCGLRHINQATISFYATELARLEALLPSAQTQQLKGGTET